MIEAFHFLRPAWLLLVPIAVVVIWLIARRSDTSRVWRQLVSPHLLDVLLVDEQRGKRSGPLFLLGIVLILGIVAVSGPAWRQQPSPFSQDAASLVIVLKVTPSMLVEDLQPTRLERGVHKIRDLLEMRLGTRTALVAYAGSAHLVMPLTRDANVINTFVSELQPEIMPQEGDNPAAALALARQQLSAAEEKGSLLWIGDGMTQDAAKLAAEEWSDSASLVMLGTLGADVATGEQEELRNAASALGAKLVLIAPDSSDVEVIQSQIRKDFTSAVVTEEGAQWQDEGYWLLFPILLLTLVWFRPGWMVKYR